MVPLLHLYNKIPTCKGKNSYKLRVVMCFPHRAENLGRTSPWQYWWNSQGRELILYNMAADHSYMPLVDNSKGDSSQKIVLQLDKGLCRLFD